MTRKRYYLTGLLFLLAGIALSCAGTKRPPAVTSARSGAGSQAANAATATPRSPVQPVDSGTDYVPAREDDLSGMDLSGDGGSPEGGPLADIHFEFDRASLTSEATAILDKHAAWLQNRATTSVTIEGHCDERGTVEYNLALGEQRARSALDYLRDHGIASDRLRVVSYGKERPIETGHGENSWAKNRRVHFAVGR